MSTDYDSPWKDMLDNYFPAFMELFFPDASAEIDWSRGYDILDTEFRQIVRDADVGRRYADKLMKVYLQSGSALFVFIHTEVQAQYDAEFTQRMFTYHYRIFDRYQEPVVSLAVLADQNEQWRPSAYSHTRWGCSLDFQFPVIKLTDYREDWSSLESSDNPFATVVMAHLKTQETHQASDDRRYWKMQLMRRLYERGFARQTILDIFNFIDWLMTLPEELEQAFEHELQEIEKEFKMPYITHLERRGKQQGIREDIQEILNERLDEVPQDVIDKLADIHDAEALRRLLRSALRAQTADEFRKRLSTDT